MIYHAPILFFQLRKNFKEKWKEQLEEQALWWSYQWLESSSTLPREAQKEKLHPSYPKLSDWNIWGISNHISNRSVLSDDTWYNKNFQRIAHHHPLHSLQSFSCPYKSFCHKSSGRQRSIKKKNPPDFFLMCFNYLTKKKSTHTCLSFYSRSIMRIH